MLSREELDGLRAACGEILPQMYHCRQCRSDAAGTLDNDQSYLFAEKPPCALPRHTAEEQMPSLRFAAATNNGLIVNEHFGHVTEFSIYECSDDDVRFIEKRDVSRYCHPSGEKNCGAHTSAIDSITSALFDCSGVLVMRIGEVPRVALAEKGIKTFLVYDYIETAVRDAASKIRAC
jgi:nitrogen fixation protein NifB